jgi:tRNA nucleotidyltransferase (CCA-adding enzyme)
VGIVTRTDLLKYLHGSHTSYWYQKIFLDSEQETFNCKHALEQLSKNILDLLKTPPAKWGMSWTSVCTWWADLSGTLLLRADNWDIDFVTEGDGIAFAKALHEAIGGKLTVHTQFETAVIRLSSHITLDIVTARREYYEYPAALPKVEKSNIWSDLFRRDFTINCMAIGLNADIYGELIRLLWRHERPSEQGNPCVVQPELYRRPHPDFPGCPVCLPVGLRHRAFHPPVYGTGTENDMISRLSNDRIREEMLHLIREQEFLPRSIALMQELGVLNHFTVDLWWGNRP